MGENKRKDLEQSFIIVTELFLIPQITGVSILRAGETMEQALTAVCKDIRLGKILIQTNHDTGEPEVPAILQFQNIWLSELEQLPWCEYFLYKI